MGKRKARLRSQALLVSRLPFLPFRTLAGHPEVMDTETHVGYLINEKFSHNSSTAMRKAAGRFLRLPGGGTSSSRIGALSLSHQSSPSGQGHKPKNFAKTELAMEA
ncbi:hypothetical protein [Paratractidigestivibacter sp.]|uniref:hypothetical protein n=1 Tax=Paratractidigestivibacter sp. TaxID=2847316 RepID=UPI002AC974B8|nr:hypothetical protein [Paratractidigestivibacter sp.]